MKPNGKTFKQNLKFKLPVFGVVPIILWFGTDAVGFPIWWQIEFVSFAFVGLLLFILLDMPSMKQETRSSPLLRILGGYARTFHDPLDKRTAKKPIPPVPTQEEIERWQAEGLFLDPLL